MRTLDHTRRGFVQAATSLAVALTTPRPLLSKEHTPDEGWLAGLDGRHRAFFDIGGIRDGILGRVDNFLSVYRDEYSLSYNQVNVVFGAHSNGLGFVLNDAVWRRYHLGDRYQVTDPSTGQPAMRNIFTTMDAADDWPTDYSVTALQARGVRFLGCRGSMRNLSRALAKANAGASAADIAKELEDNVLPDVIPVPAMIVAQNRAQEAGLHYVYVV